MRQTLHPVAALLYTALMLTTTTTTTTAATTSTTYDYVQFLFNWQILYRKTK